jgi:hypothetical protein
MIVPTLRVGMQPGTLRVPKRRDAERHRRHSHAERGNDHERSVECQPIVIRLALPPAAAVLTLNARSITRRSNAMLVSPCDKP